MSKLDIYIKIVGTHDDGNDVMRFVDVGSESVLAATVNLSILDEMTTQD